MVSAVNSEIYGSCVPVAYQLRAQRASETRSAFGVTGGLLSHTSAEVAAAGDVRSGAWILPGSLRSCCDQYPRQSDGEAKPKRALFRCCLAGRGSPDRALRLVVER